jgi:hypothetical protein
MRLYVPNLLRDIVAGGAAAAYGVGYADGSALLHTDASAFTLGTDPIQSQIIQALKPAVYRWLPRCRFRQLAARLAGLSPSE